MRILIPAPNHRRRYNWGHQLFRDEIGRQSEAVYWGPGFPGFDPDLEMEAVIRRQGPFDVVLTHFAKHSRWIRGLGRFSSALKVHIINDYEPREGRSAFHHWFFDRDRYDLLFARTRYEWALARRNRSEPVRYLPFSVDRRVYCDPGAERDIDAAAVWSWNAKHGHMYPLRRRVRNLLDGLAEAGRLRAWTRPVVREAYAAVLGRSKIFIAAGSRLGCLPMKWTEATACGCLLLSTPAEDARVQGFREGRHWVCYRDLKELKEKLFHYVRHEDERRRIAAAGRDFVLAHHTNEIRVRQMLRIIEAHRGAA